MDANPPEAPPAQFDEERHCWCCNECDDALTAATVFHDEGDRMGILGACAAHHADFVADYATTGETLPPFFATYAEAAGR